MQILCCDSLARSNSSFLYGNKVKLYDRLRRHAYQGRKKGIDHSILQYLIIQFYKFVPFGLSRVKSGNERTSESDGHERKQNTNLNLVLCVLVAKRKVSFVVWYIFLHEFWIVDSSNIWVQRIIANILSVRFFIRYSMRVTDVNLRSLKPRAQRLWKRSPSRK